MPASEPSEGRVHWGHFILRVQRLGRDRPGALFVVECARTGHRGQYDRLEDALAFIQAHLSPEDDENS